MSEQSRIETLWSEKLITRTMLRFGRSLDTGDWGAYASCFTDPVNINFKRLTGFDEVRVDAKLWANFADRILSPMRRHHMLSNFQIDVDGDRAYALVYMVSSHWKQTDIGGGMNQQLGWYDVWFEREGDAWKIARLKHDFQWIAGNGGLFENQDPALGEAAQRVFAPENMKAAADYLKARGA